MPPHYGSTILSTYDFHNKILFWQHSEAIGFWLYVLSFKAAAPKILLSQDLHFFQPKDFYIYLH